MSLQNQSRQFLIRKTEELAKIDNVKTSPERQVKARPTHSGLRYLFVCLCFFACRLSGAEDPDLLFVNGNIYTVNAPQPRAESIAVKNHRVVFVGSNSEAEKFK